MKFFLEKEKRIVFTDIPAKTKPNPDFYAERQVLVAADLHLDETNSDEDSKSFLMLLKSIINNDPFDKVARKCLPSREGDKQDVTLESEKSDVFEKAFAGSFEESKTKVVEMPDMTSSGVNALLAFLYYGDLEKAAGNSATAVEVLQASHKYNVGSLEEQMKNVFLPKPDEWFDVEAALKLFLFARLLEQEETLKFRAVQLIKANFASFESSPIYDELFKKNPEAAKELFKVVCML